MILEFYKLDYAVTVHLETFDVELTHEVRIPRGSPLITGNPLAARWSEPNAEIMEWLEELGNQYDISYQRNDVLIAMTEKDAIRFKITFG